MQDHSTKPRKLSSEAAKFMIQSVFHFLESQEDRCKGPKTSLVQDMRDGVVKLISSLQIDDIFEDARVKTNKNILEIFLKQPLALTLSPFKQNAVLALSERETIVKRLEGK